jgi:hypothetical protein
MIPEILCTHSPLTEIQLTQDEFGHCAVLPHSLAQPLIGIPMMKVLDGNSRILKNSEQVRNRLSSI